MLRNTRGERVSHLQALITHSPILAIAVPLFAAFLTPLIGRFGPRARSAFVVAVLAFVEFLVLILARDVYANGIRIYTLGAVSLTCDSRELHDSGSHRARDRWTRRLHGYDCGDGGPRGRHLLHLLHQGRDRTGQVLHPAIPADGGHDRIQFTGDMFNLFVFLEILSISGAALAAYRTRFIDAVEGGFKYLIVSTVAALMVLIATALFYAQYNVLNIAAIADAMQYTALDKIALALLIIALLTKSGGVPSHWWVPDTYTPAPAGTSPMIYAATLACMSTMFRIAFTLFGIKMSVATIGGRSSSRVC